MGLLPWLGGGPGQLLKKISGAEKMVRWSLLFVFCIAVFALCGSDLLAQDCANGKCFRTPVRNGLALPGCDCQQSSSFRVGGYNEEGYLITSIGEPASPSAEVSALGIRKRKASREAIIEAANRAHADCTINSDELKAIRLACMSPRMLAKIEDLIIEKAQNSGAYTFALKANGEVDKAAIDWEAIGDFILKIAPIIFKLIELFALDTSIDNSVQFASAVEQSPNFVATVGRLSLSC